MTRAVGVMLVGLFSIMACIVFALSVSGAFGANAEALDERSNVGAARELIDATGDDQSFGLFLIDSLRLFPWVLMFIIAAGTMIFFIYWIIRRLM